MFDALAQGVFLGLVLSIFVGPVFFMLVKTSVSHGVKAALILDAGIVFSDVFCIALSYFGLAQLMQRPSFSFAFGIGGGILLVAYGIYTAFKKEKLQETKVPASITKAHGIKLFAKGFIFNTSVPSVIFFWIATVSLAIAQFQNNRVLTITYLASVVLSYFAIDILKIYLASKAKKFFTGDKQHVVKKLAGIALIIFGAVIIFKVITTR